MYKLLKIKFLLNRADSLFGKKDFENSLKYYNKVLSLDNSHLHALYRKSYILYNANDFDEAINILISIVEKNNSEESLLLLGRIYFLRNDIEIGIQYYSLALEENIFNPSLFFKEIYFFGNYKFRYLYVNYENLFKFSIVLADLYLNRYDFVDSEGLFIEANTWKSLTLYNLNKLDESLDIVNKLIRMNLINSFTYYLKSNILLKLKCFDDALIYINKALDMDSEEPILNQTKAEILYYLKNYEESLKYLKKVTNKRNLADSYFFISKIHIKKYDFNSALKNINKAVEIENISYNQLNDKSARIYYDSDYFDLYWYKSLILSKLSQFDEANKIIDCLLEKEESAKNYCLKAKILYDMKDYENAITFADKALDLNPDCKQAIELKEKIKNLK